MSMSALQLFSTLLIIQLFWSFGVTLMVPQMPNAQSNEVLQFTASYNLIDLSSLQSSVSEGVSEQTNIPVLETGALIFYASATILNLMVNFFTAIPQMVTLIIHILFMVIPFEASVTSIVEQWIFGIVSVLYTIVIFAFVAGSRTNLGGGGIF